MQVIHCSKFILIIKPSVNSTESIYVRIYEERMDLLRAAVIGAPGTPYHDGLFFFDIYLPPEYPHEPPVSYLNLELHSFIILRMLE